MFTLGVTKVVEEKMVILQFVVNRGFLQFCNLHISSPNNVTQSIRNQVLSCFSDVDEVWGDHEPKKVLVA